jgi:hypothetical protein
MNVTTSSFSLTQMILAWTLLGLLLSWFIIFTALALREFVIKNAEWEDLPTPTGPIPAFSAQPAEEQRQYVGVAGGNNRHEGTNTEQSWDNSTSLITKTK